MPYLEMKGITKLYPNDVLANDRVDFAVERGEIHAIVGENGAGKTTLMRILFGLEQPDSGAISLDGRPAAVRTPLDAVRLGIGMVHQHFTLIPEFTVTENVVIGAEPRKAGIIIDAEAAVERIAAEIKAHGFGIEPRARVSRLTVGQMQQVEILKMLYRRADLLVLDEPTAVLAEQEIRGLFDTMRSLRGAGKTCVFVTHKLREVKEIADRVTVMRKGSVVAVRRAAEVDKAELSRLMVGKSVLFQVRRERGGQGEPVLELRGATVRQRGRRRPLLDGVDLTVRAREIVGVTGVSGNGLDELEDVVSGLRRVSSGTILHNGENVSAMGPARLRARGIAYVPSDRLRRGASLLSSVAENLIVSNHHAFLRAGFLNRAKIERFAEGLARDFSIDGRPGSPLGTLSGGNIQKVILARELSSASTLIVFCEPGWGLDVAASQFVYEKILEARSAGAAVLLISSNLDEVLGLADSIAVMYKGRVVAVADNAPGLTKAIIGEYMLGLREEPRPAGQRGGGGAP